MSTGEIVVDTQDKKLKSFYEYESLHIFFCDGVWDVMYDYNLKRFAKHASYNHLILPSLSYRCKIT